MYFFRNGTLIAAALLVTTAFHGEAQAQYQEGDEITVLMGYEPGGGSDALAQLIQPFLQEELGVNFVNEYRPGASGAVAWTRIAKQTEPDGETITITTTPTVVTNPMMNEAIQYDLSELDLLANIVTDPGVIVVAADSPYQTAEDLFTAAKENPGRITIGNSGVGGDDYFTTLMVEDAVGVDFQPVPFEGDGPSWSAAMGGKIDASFNNLGITYPQIEAGNLRPLALMAEERHPDLPDVPTLGELGYDIVSGSSRGYGAPAGIPEDKREALISAMEKITQDPEFLAQARERAMNIDFMGGEEYEQYLLDMRESYEQYLDQAEADQQQQN